ncbi:MAG TPA: FUSC family protein, partial [Flavobacteriales bacterium]|nr:FUSC family protein [Flavobacteriales bacterium]
ITRNYMLGLVFITPLALALATFGQDLDPTSTMSGRLYDTLLGAGVALVVLAVLEGMRRMGRR